MEALIHKAKQGDNAALNELINSHRDLAFSIALNILKNKADAEDIVQNSFLIVLKSLHSFKNESKFSTWLFKIVYRESLRELKKKQKMRKLSTAITKYEEATSEDPFSVDTKEINITKLLVYLNEKEYIVTSLFYLKEKSINDIIKITSFSKSNIKVLLHRARQKLKEITLDTSFYHEK